jgi:hypothetical protein
MQAYMYVCIYSITHLICTGVKNISNNVYRLQIIK